MYWWLAFLVLTIAGERLELLVGVAVAARWPEAGVRLLGAGLLALTAWLMRMACRTIHQRDVTR